MEKNNIARIISKFLSARFSLETEERVQKWIIKEKNTEEKEKASLAYWNDLNRLNKLNELNKPNELDLKADQSTYAAWERVNRRIGLKKTQPAKISFNRKITRIAAIMIPLFALAGGYLYYTSTTHNLIEVSAAYGEKKHLLLPDNSEIWLNAGTTIKYPKAFANDQRLVLLDGEAYFSVRKDAARPFIVKTPQLSVKVLGTRFNVKAYSKDETITTTLTSGKVEVNVSFQSSRILKPNEQLTYDKSTSNISLSKTPSGDTEGWITGKLIFTGTSFTEILQTLERRYKIVFDNTTSISSSKRYTVRFLKNESLDETLSILEDMIGFSYQKKENRILLTDK